VEKDHRQSHPKKEAILSHLVERKAILVVVSLQFTSIVSSLSPFFSEFLKFYLFFYFFHLNSIEFIYVLKTLLESIATTNVH
jgi:hypothetical protein